MPDEDVLIVLVAIGAGVLIALTSIIGGMVSRTARTRQTEESRREIAAYVAEGSMTADEGERLLNAGRRAEERKLA